MKIGVAPFLNVKPLIYKIEREKKVELIYGSPRELSKKLKEGSIDVGIIPSVDYLKGIGDYIIPNISISSYGKVESVKLFYKGKLKEIKEVGVDEGSSTSMALLKIILNELYSINPKFFSINPSDEKAFVENEAVMLIGDIALIKKGKHIDLGEAWYRLTNLPFIYAFWVSKNGDNLKELSLLLNESKNWGINNIEKIIQEESKRLKIKKNIIDNYLKNTIKYDLKERELQGFFTFTKYLLKYGIINHQRELNFLD
jgi:chorismate dehydratase